MYETFETINFNIFELNICEITNSNNSGSQLIEPEPVEETKKPSVESLNKNKNARPIRKYVFRRFDWEREGTPNVL